MRIEDFVSTDKGVRALIRPVSRKHVVAIGSTLLIATALSFALQNKSSIPADQALLPEQSVTSSASGHTAGSENSNYVLTPSDQEALRRTALISSSDSDYTPAERIKNEVRRMVDPKATLTENLSAQKEQALFEPTEDSNIEVAKHSVPMDNYDDALAEEMLSDADSQIDNEIRQKASAEEQKHGHTMMQAKWYVENIEKGDTISSVFSDLNIPYATMQAITSSKAAGTSLTSLRPGYTLSFLIDDDNKLVSFVKQLNKTEQLRFTRTDTSKLNFEVVREKIGAHLQDDSDALVAEVTGQQGPSIALEKKPENQVTMPPAQIAKAVPLYQRRGRLVKVTIEKGEVFSTAALQAGLTYGEIDQILKLFKGRIQFSRHIQPGDTMRVLFSDTKGKGKINAVEFDLKRLGKISTFRNMADNKYYDENGLNSTSGSFRRYPLDGKIRITSNFNPGRRHPITGRVRPHNGTDFGVPVGTKVIAPADGVVDKATYSRSAGYYLVLRHRGSYSTVYMHLSKINVKPGQRVKMGSVIARSGNTGMSTGPHLHYELRRNGRPVNAMRVTLPHNMDSAVSQKQQQLFAANVKKYKQQLHQEGLIAQLD